MSTEARSARSLDRPVATPEQAPGTPASLPPAPGLTPDTEVALAIRGMVERGEMDRARSEFGVLVASHQRRAARIAFQYLRDAADADEAVQDAFVKVFSHITSYREAWPFEVWFTRILINGCLDRRKSRARRERWAAPLDELKRAPTSQGLDPESQLLAGERRERIAAAVGRLGGKQRLVFTLCHYGDCSPKEVSAITGMNESTVRVHLFRAARKLQALLGGRS